MKNQTKQYRKEHWTKWIRRDLIQIGYWPQYTEKQYDWVNFDPKKIVRDLVEGQIDVLHCGIPENWYPVDGGCAQRHPALKALSYDPFQQLVEECHKNGKKILFYLATNAAVGGINEYFSNYPEAIAKQGLKFKKGDKLPRQFRLCILNPVFLKGYFELVRCLMKTYDFDGLTVDGPWCWEESGGTDPKTGRFTCEYCAEDYRKYSGRTTVPKEDWSDPAWYTYIKWRHERFADFLKKNRKVVKDYDDRIFFSANNLLNPHDGWNSRIKPDLLKEMVDSPFFECNLNGPGLLEPSMKMKFGYTATDGTASGNCHKSADLNPGGFADAKPSYVDVATLAYQGLIHGSFVHLHSTMDQYAAPHPLRTEVYKKFSREVAGKKEWLVNSVPQAHVGIFYSTKTRDRYAGPCIPAFMHAFLGAERMMVEAHIPSGFLIERQMDVEHLRRFKCVILPNVACMSDREIDAVRRYVKEGGALIATGETSLYDENEKFRKNFGLADVFGVRFAGVSERAKKVLSGKEPLWKKYPYLLHSHEITENFRVEDKDLTWLPYFSIEKTSRSYQTIASWLNLEEDTIWPVNTGRFITGDSGEPCIVAGSYGKGRTVYISSDFTGFYVTRCFRTTRELMAAMVEWASPIAISAVCPKSIELAVAKQDGKKHVVVHLLNYAVFNKGYDNMLAQGGYFNADGVFMPFSSTSNMRSHPRTDMDKELAEAAMKWRLRPARIEMPLCDEMIPVHNAKLLIDKAFKKTIKKAYTAPEGKPLKVAGRGNKFEITVPEVQIHQMVVIE